MRQILLSLGLSNVKPACQVFQKRQSASPGILRSTSFGSYRQAKKASTPNYHLVILNQKIFHDILGKKDPLK